MKEILCSKPRGEMPEDFKRTHRVLHRFMRIFCVQIGHNSMHVFEPDEPDGGEAQAPQPFSTERLLIGSLENAVFCLSRTLAARFPRIPHFRPYLQLQDTLHLDQEISEVEYQALERVGYLSGASGVGVFDRLGNRVVRQYEVR